VALKDAVAKLPKEMPGALAPAQGVPIPARYDPAYYDPAGAVIDQLAAVSVGVVEGQVRLDLDYYDDSRAGVDMNVALTAGGKFVEIQGAAAHGEGFDRGTMNRLLDLAERGGRGLMELQRAALGR
jgi:ribonuclease PH